MLTGLHTALVRRALLPLRERHRGNSTFHRLCSLLASQWWPPERIRDAQLLRLRALVARAAEAPYYRDRLRQASVRPEDLRQVEDLAALPLLEKAVLRERPDTLSPRGPDGGTRRRRTSGSTGVPVEVWVPADGWVAAARLMRLDWRGQARGPVALLLDWDPHDPLAGWCAPGRLRVEGTRLVRLRTRRAGRGV
ncbi:MAG: hypothetical protein QN122_09845 [Armatimonadota bacterium]|nr:hypothetical protein [Armatimonadota bacterium]MDR7447940.1 hypothetical protein [Armatimonadota bacterium]MDR7458204.1 hypothetical protein [Armatimonadota bacterium]MDR7478491.1 hypothetical protein [Armatimonadota bacterium]MDR7488754.1 hypothetical protein [Armatimonadota bacterium]